MAKIYEISTFWRGSFQRSGNNLFEHKKVFQIIGTVLRAEHSIKFFTSIFQDFCLNLKSIITIIKELMNGFWNDFTRTAHDACFYLYGYKNKTNIKVAVSNVNIKIHQLFSKQRILDVCVTIAQWKISGNLTRICF